MQNVFEACAACKMCLRHVRHAEYVSGICGQGRARMGFSPTLEDHTVESRYLELAYFELPLISKHETMTTGNKIMWKRGEIAPKEQFLLFSTLFYTLFLTSGVKLHIHLLNAVVQLFFSSLSQL